jgi:hypothetical protein
MTVTDLPETRSVAAGWYPDPVDPAGLRWWSGENWTEHTSPLQPVVTVQEPAQPVQPQGSFDAVVADVAPDLARFSRYPLVTGQPASVANATASVVRRKDPYRDRNVISGVALAIAVLGLLAFVAGQLLDVPDLILYLAGGTPFAIATFAIVVAITTGRGLMIAIIAAVLSILNMGMVMALNALDARDLVTTVEDSTSFEHVLEQSVVDATNGLARPALAVSADCPDVPTPAKGTVTDCTVTLDNGDMYLVHVTSEDGLGGMSFELVDVVIGSAN